MHSRPQPSPTCRQSTELQASRPGLVPGVIPESPGRTPAIREDPSMTHPTPGGAGLRIAPATPRLDAGLPTPPRPKHSAARHRRTPPPPRRTRDFNGGGLRACRHARRMPQRPNRRLQDMGQGDLAALPRGRRATRTGLPAPDAQIAPGHRQIRAAAHFANGSRVYCTTEQTTGICLRSTGSVRSPIARSCVAAQ